MPGPGDWARSRPTVGEATGVPAVGARARGSTGPPLAETRRTLLAAGVSADKAISAVRRPAGRAARSEESSAAAARFRLAGRQRTSVRHHASHSPSGGGPCLTSTEEALNRRVCGSAAAARPRGVQPRGRPLPRARAGLRETLVPSSAEPGCFAPTAADPRRPSGCPTGVRDRPPREHGAARPSTLLRCPARAAVGLQQRRTSPHAIDASHLALAR
jgi:hypothetical protein